MTDEYTVIHICCDCGTETTYWRSDGCDHEDWHVASIASDDVPCGPCLEAYMLWTERDLYVDGEYVETLIRAAS